jgi:hypothetical protein
MTARWTVHYHHEFMDGSGTKDYEKPTDHRTYVGADFHRRFRYNHAGLGSCWVTTEMVPAAGVELVGERYEAALKRLWAALYWVRARWDGLRYGRDRDSRW